MAHDFAMALFELAFVRCGVLLEDIPTSYNQLRAGRSPVGQEGLNGAIHVRFIWHVSIYAMEDSPQAKAALQEVLNTGTEVRGSSVPRLSVSHSAPQEGFEWR